MIPWEWIVDETRELESRPSWINSRHYMLDLNDTYRRDYWQHQPVQIEVWSEKGTVRGVLAPVLDKYGVGFRALHGFNSATVVHDVAVDRDLADNRPLIALYVGDYDPSGMCMTEELPNWLERYGGTHVQLRRVALLREHVTNLPSFPASDKRKDLRYKWFVKNYGERCWEFDAMNPNDLRALVRQAIEAEIDWPAWNHWKNVGDAERETINTYLAAFGMPAEQQIGTSPKIVPPSGSGLWFHNL
jgi:hypothetical protein